MGSIKKKLIISFLFVIICTIGLFNILISMFVKNYYYANVEQMLKNQVLVTTTFYNKYFSQNSLVNNVYDDVDTFWNQTGAQVQILDNRGKLLMDSLGTYDKSILNTPDIKKALGRESGRWVCTPEGSNENVMIVSHPIISNNNVEGVIRFIVTLKDVDNNIAKIQNSFIGVSILVLFIGIIITIVLANKIIQPIKELTHVAETMAEGNVKIRTEIESNDEVGQLANTLNYMADEIENREQLKNEFISSVSHELRTPLTAIKGWAITLNDDETDRETLKLGFDIIEKETDRLSNMVEELLDFSKLVGGKINLNKRNVNIVILINYIKNYMEPTAKRVGVNFEIQGDISTLGEGYIDPDRFKQVLINIIDNAFKFTEKEGSIVMMVNKVEDNLILSIQDNGCGISKEDLPRVKEKFYKGKNSKSQNGIGLSICDEIIKLHNGEFNIESELGVGTTVTISIPIEKGGQSNETI